MRRPRYRQDLRKGNLRRRMERKQKRNRHGLSVKSSRLAETEQAHRFREHGCNSNRAHRGCRCAASSFDATSLGILGRFGMFLCTRMLLDREEVVFSGERARHLVKSSGTDGTM